jgi:predicted transcriptional regulator
MHLIRIDVAGNISKRFSASGIRFARFSGACPRWNVFSAFLTPGMIKVQLSVMPDGKRYFCLSRTIRKDSWGYHAPHAVQAIGLGCQVQIAKELVYSDGMDLSDEGASVPEEEWMYESDSGVAAVSPRAKRGSHVRGSDRASSAGSVGARRV